MDYHAAFLAAIYAQPNDDTPRLVYADWLEEHGQPERAELIRLQCRAVSGEPLNWDEDNRAFDLEDDNRKTWTAHLPQAEGVEWRFHRGFPEELAIDLGVMLDRWSIWSGLSRVRCLSLGDTTEDSLRAFARHCWHPDWRVLRLSEHPHPLAHSYWASSSGVRDLVMTPQAVQIRELYLTLPRLPLYEQDVVALCESPYLKNLLILGREAGYHEEPRLGERFGPRLRRFSWIDSIHSRVAEWGAS